MPRILEVCNKGGYWTRLEIFSQLKFSKKLFYNRSSSLEYIALMFKLILRLSLTFIFCTQVIPQNSRLVGHGGLPIVWCWATATIPLTEGESLEI